MLQVGGGRDDLKSNRLKPIEKISFTLQSYYSLVPNLLISKPGTSLVGGDEQQDCHKRKANLKCFISGT